MDWHWLYARLILAAKSLYRRLILIRMNILEWFWGVRWYLRYRTGRSNWKELRSYPLRHYCGSDEELRQIRRVDDVKIVKQARWIAHAALASALKEETFFEKPQTDTVKDISFIIPFGDRRGDRLPLLQLCLNRITQVFPSAQVIVSDLYGNLEIPQAFFSAMPRLSIIRRQEEGMDFNIALAVNYGVFQATEATLCILQADILVPNEMQLVIREFQKKQYDYWFPALGVFFLDLPSTLGLIQGKHRPLFPGSYCRALESYCLIIKRAVYEEIGGYLPLYTQSAEDGDFYDRLDGFYTAPNRPLALLHLYHPPYWVMDKEAADRNRALLLTKRSLPIHLRREEARQHLNLLRNDQFLA